MRSFSSEIAHSVLEEDGNPKLDLPNPNIKVKETSKYRYIFLIPLYDLLFGMHIA